MSWTLLRGDAGRDRGGGRHGREVHRRRGDGRFGVPVAHEDDPDARSARRCGCSAGSPALNERAARRARGRAGHPDRRQHRPGDAPRSPRRARRWSTGDPVNLAARLRAAGGARAVVLVGERTAAAARGFALDAFDEPLELRGKAEAVPPVRCWSASATSRDRGYRRACARRWSDATPSSTLLRQPASPRRATSAGPPRHDLRRRRAWASPG